MATEEVFAIPLDVPYPAVDTFIANYQRVTRGTGRLMLFAGDQKVEHLNDDFLAREFLRMMQNLITSSGLHPREKSGSLPHSTG